MKKKNKTEIILSFLLIWIPSIFYLYKNNFVYNTELSVNLFLIPLIMYVFSLFCILVASILRKNGKIPNVLYYVICISIPLCFSIDRFLTALDYSGSYDGILKNNNIIAGLLIIVVGNYLPKTQFSKFVGLKFWWLKKRQDIWKKAHLLAGYLWIIAGFIMILSNKPTSKTNIIVYFLLLYIIPLIYAMFLNIFTKNKRTYK